MAPPTTLNRAPAGDVVLRYREHLQLRVARNELAATSLTAYLRDIEEFLAIVGSSTILDDLEAEHLEAALVRIANAPDRRYTRGVKIGADGGRTAGRSPHSLSRWFVSVRGLFRWAAQRGYVQVDPALQVRPPKPPRRAAGARLGISLDDARTLRTAPARRRPEDLDARSRLTARDEAVLRLLVESGPRVAEVTGANRADIRVHEETDRPVLRVRGKGGKTRDLPLTPVTLAAIERYQAEERPDPPAVRDPHDVKERARLADCRAALFVTIRGRRMSPRDVERMVERYALANLGYRVTPHGLRHTALTILARSGVDIATVSDIAGHDNLSTTSVYMDTSMLAAADAVDGSPLARGAD